MMIVRKILIGLYLFLALVYAVIFDSELGWGIFFFFSLFFLTTFFLLYESIRQIELDVSDDLIGNVGDKKNITIKLTSQKQRYLFYPVLLLKNEALGINQHLIWNFFKRKELYVEWIPLKRGYYNSLEIEVTSSDFFGLLYKKERLLIEKKIIILPKEFEKIDDLLWLVEPRVQKNLFGQTTFDFERLRLYQSGDSVKLIDWKASSKIQQLIVKEYEMYQPTKAVFIFYGVASFNYEKMLSIYFSLYQNIQSQYCRFVIMEDLDKVIEEPTLEDFSKLTKSENPGRIPETNGEIILVFTPEKTKRLLRELMAHNGKKDVQVIDYQMIKEKIYGKEK